jgi:hypothetical protein
MRENMKIAKPKKLLNPYEWLPGFGETRVELRRGDGLNLNLDVFYESDGSGLKKRTITFKNAWSFIFGAAAWVQTTKFVYEDNEAHKKMIGSLVEYESSEAAKTLQENLPPGLGPLKHFEIYFMSANESLCVFAEDFALAPAE